jgi:hypothetical protein
VVRRQVVLFWGSAVAVAGGVALLAALLFPYQGLGMTTREEREWAWLVTVWTGGVLMILFGLSAVLGWGSGLGFRDVYDSLRVSPGQGADEARARVQERIEQSRRRVGTAFHGNFAWWVVSTGGLLILTYFGGWLVLRA